MDNAWLTCLTLTWTCIHHFVLGYLDRSIFWKMVDWRKEITHFLNHNSLHPKSWKHVCINIFTIYVITYLHSHLPAKNIQCLFQGSRILSVCWHLLHNALSGSWIFSLFLHCSPSPSGRPLLLFLGLVHFKTTHGISSNVTVILKHQIFNIII